MHTKIRYIILIFSLCFPVVSCGSHQHSLTFVEEKISTCLEKGYQAHYVCNECGKLFNQDKQEVTLEMITYPLGDHTGSYIVDEQYHDGICSVCNQHDHDIHMYTHKVISPEYLKSEKTCASYAKYYYSCHCGHSSGNTVREVCFDDVAGGKLEHQYVFNDYLAPTDDEDGHQAYYSCSNCDTIFNLNKEEIPSIPVIECPKQITIINRKNGAEVTFVSDSTKGYLNTKDVAKYLHETSSKSGDFTSGLYLAWSIKQAESPYKVQFSRTKVFNEIIYEESNINALNVTVYNTLPGINYYRIVDKNGNTSSVDYFVNPISIRTINTDSAITNMRDLGGYKTEDNKTINYGFIYRSAEWKPGSDKSISLLKQLGMKTELDIRKGTSYEASKNPIDGVNFYNYGMGQYTQVIPGEIQYSVSNKENLFYIFEILSDEKNYPLTYHCTAGADRTGTLSFLILGMLGVPYESLVKDFELTSFYHSRRWRSKINVDKDGNCVFDESGIMQQDSGNYIAFNHMFNCFLKNYNIGDNKLSNCIKNYLINECGITTQMINKIASIMLSEE